MKSIYLKSVLAFIFVGVMAMLICGLFYNDYLEQQPATPEQLTEIIQDTPCAAEAFKEAIKSDTSDYQPEPLSLGKAKKLASACRERSKRLVRTVLIFTESSDQLSRATDRVPGLPASPGYVQ